MYQRLLNIAVDQGKPPSPAACTFFEPIAAALPDPVPDRDCIVGAGIFLERLRRVRRAVAARNIAASRAGIALPSSRLIAPLCRTVTAPPLTTERNECYPLGCPR
jgi:hypothetical protein